MLSRQECLLIRPMRASLRPFMPKAAIEGRAPGIAASLSSAIPYVPAMTVLETHDTAGRSAPASRVLWRDELTGTIKLAVPMAATWAAR